VLAQDWTILFNSAGTTEKRFYVYAHIDMREKPIPLHGLDVTCPGEPFYIGKGTGQRAWDLKRNQGHGKRLKQIKNAGFPDKAIVFLIAENLSEQEAFILEAKLIYFFGSIYDETIHGCLLNLADHIKPTFVGTMQKIPSRKSCLPREEYACYVDKPECW
jgi:hypothetical protein